MTHPESTPIDAARATSVFAEFASRDDLALSFPADACYARAHIMVQELIQHGMSPRKVWAFAASVADLLWTEADNRPDGRVEWSYHVAPVVVVRGLTGESHELVLEPVLFDRPVAVNEWLAALHDAPTVIRTAPEEPPLPARGGSGYWPGPDPIEGADIHARETLDEYRRPLA